MVDKSILGPAAFRVGMPNGSTLSFASDDRMCGAVVAHCPHVCAADKKDCNFTAGKKDCIELECSKRAEDGFAPSYPSRGCRCIKRPGFGAKCRDKCFSSTGLHDKLMKTALSGHAFTVM
jgi:hypothetical protein